LQELPTSIGHLHALQNLHLNKHFSLPELLTSINQLTTLEKLGLSGCFKLKE
ncbi:unnamed protein product, partial [Sphagnum balticum]